MTRNEKKTAIENMAERFMNISDLVPNGGSRNKQEAHIRKAHTVGYSLK